MVGVGSTAIETGTAPLTPSSPTLPHVHSATDSITALAGDGTLRWRCRAARHDYENTSPANMAPHDQALRHSPSPRAFRPERGDVCGLR